MKFRSKPVIIEAWQYDGDPDTPGVCNCPEPSTGTIRLHVHTMHENQRVYLEYGDWIVPEPVPNRYYPIKPDVFAKKYEPV